MKKAEPKTPRKKAATGRVMASGLIDATIPSTNRQQRQIAVRDIKKEITPYDFRLLLALSRSLYMNLGIPRGAIADKAVYAVGRAWAPVHTGADKAWGKRATQWLAEEWYGSCDMAGPMFDFATSLCVGSIAIDRDGDFGILLTKDKSGWPMFQMISANRLWSEPGAKAAAGTFWDKGILFSNEGTPLKYRIKNNERSESSEDFMDVPASSFIHIFDPEWFSQGRGIPAFTHAILDLGDYQEVQNFEKVAVKVCSALTLIETNEDGTADTGSLKNAGEHPVNTEFKKELMENGLIRYLKAGSGAKIEPFKSERPTTATTEFLDRLIRGALVGVGWPYELLWDAKNARGANIRAIVARAARTVEDRQDTLRYAARRMVGYAVATAIKKGILPFSEDWWKWNFTMPPHISVDAGYDAQADREDYKMGLKNLSQILGKFGIDVEEHLRQRAAEKVLAREIASENGMSEAELMGAVFELPAPSLAGVDHGN
jgi:capsid protein